jgi:UDPglucose 6-dehydrogenase
VRQRQEVQTLPRSGRLSVERLAFFGLGRLGLTLAALFARSGITTVGIDANPALIQQLQSGAEPLVEPGLGALLAEAARTLTYASDPAAAADADASIILVATPSDSVEPAYSSSDVVKACTDLCHVLRSRATWRYHLIVICSTLWPGTISSTIVPLLEEQLSRRAGADFGIVYVPEFVALGDLMHGFEQPAFLVIGTDDDAAGVGAAALFQRITDAATPVRFLKTRDAELLKVALNVFTCMKVSFANWLGQLGDRLGGIDVDAVTDTLSLHPRVGAGYVRAGAPYAGTCLPRDVDAVLHLAASVGLRAPLVDATAAINAAQFDVIERDVLVGGTRCVAILGLSFKPGTSVTVGSPALEFARRFLDRSVRVVAFDPIGMARESARAWFGGSVDVCETLDEALGGADTILVCNPDPSFTGLASLAPADRRIVDPWGCVIGAHPGLVRPGRNSHGAVPVEIR